MVKKKRIPKNGDLKRIHKGGNLKKKVKEKINRTCEKERRPSAVLWHHHQQGSGSSVITAVFVGGSTATVADVITD